MTSVAQAGDAIMAQAGDFLPWLGKWYEDLPVVSFDRVFPNPAKGAILVQDLLIGFARSGPLASERVEAVIDPTVRLLERAHARGMHRFLMSQDAHSPDSPEFEAWPAHCVKGTEEARLVPEIEGLPFSDEFTVIEKNCLSTGLDPRLNAWLEENRDVTSFLVTGDCTDLCVYQLAMFLRMWANSGNRAGKQVWVDASAVATYDLPVPAPAGALPHPGDLMHVFFLYHLALNGVRVAGRIG